MERLRRAEFEQLTTQKREEIIEDTMGRLSVPREYAEGLLNDTMKDAVFVNDQYQVNVRVMDKTYHGSRVVWLSIKRLDKEACHDWRDFQEIKNQLVGPECEGIELYPAEGRVTDMANQYHLWVIADPKFRWPFGFQHGITHYSQDARHSKQRGKGK
jgi:hypothetical protein